MTSDILRTIQHTEDGNGGLNSKLYKQVANMWARIIYFRAESNAEQFYHYSDELQVVGRGGAIFFSKLNKYP
jgi:hypothetical protein